MAGGRSNGSENRASAVYYGRSLAPARGFVAAASWLSAGVVGLAGLPRRVAPQALWPNPIFNPNRNPDRNPDRNHGR